ncbi:MAG: carboxypeptidase regulatory-like domain-containing protein [Acidobacteria bacterium]|nr:carboxypeptidase regulatory-like domain-containing protein [Acidobacteriota bacterium]
MKFLNGATTMIQVLLFALLWMWLGQSSECHCREATPNEVPQGANEYIELPDAYQRRIYGVVDLIFLDSVEGAVVEVYALPKDFPQTKHHAIPSTFKRIAARTTAADGRFCFPKLPPGRYFLVAGQKKSNGMNTVQIVVTISPKAKTNKPLELQLTAGT